jgi:hypothetical protein
MDPDHFVYDRLYGVYKMITTIDRSAEVDKSLTVEEVQLSGLSSLLVKALLGLAIYFAVYRLGFLKGVVVRGVKVDAIADDLAYKVDLRCKESEFLQDVKKDVNQMYLGADLEASTVLDTVLDSSVFQDVSQKWQAGCKEALIALQGGQTTARAMLDVNVSHEKGGLLADTDDAYESDVHLFTQGLDFGVPEPPKTEDFAHFDPKEGIQVTAANQEQEEEESLL